MTRSAFGRWVDGVFGRGRRPARRVAVKPRARLSLSQMEERAVPAAWTYSGTAASEVIRVIPDLTGPGIYIENLTLGTAEYRSDVTGGLTVNALGGDDLIAIVAGTDVPIVVNGGNGSDELQMLGTSITDNFYAGGSSISLGGDQTVYIGSDVENTFAVGAGGDDALSVYAGLARAVGFVGGAGSDTAYFNGSAGADTYYASGSSVSRAGDATVALASDVETAGVYGNDGDDALSVYAGLTRAVGFVGGAGSDVVNMIGSAGADTYYGAAGSVSRSGDAVISFGTDVENVSIYAGAGNDTATVNVNFAVTISFDGGSDTDTLFLTANEPLNVYKTNTGTGSGYYTFSSVQQPSPAYKTVYFSGTENTP